MPNNQTYDIIILGAGPAGIQAAIHAARKKSSVLMLGRTSKSSLFWAHVENFCCQLKVSGEEMLRTGLEQAQNFGAVFIEEDALSIEPRGKFFAVSSESGDEFVARSLVVATGTTRNKLGIPGEKELLGRGVSYCVDCDGGFFRNDRVAVVGGLSAAAGGALTLSQIASEVTLVCPTGLEVADGLRKRIEESGIRVIENVKPKAILGENAVEGLELENGEDLEVAGVFIELGAKGVLELASTLGLKLDDSMRYIETDKKQATNVPGVFGAGDICGPPLQIAKAVGEGCVAGIGAANYARKLLGAEQTPPEDD